MPHDISLITTIAGGLGLALVLGLLAARFKLPPLLGYLLAGITIGPHTPGFVADIELAAQLAAERLVTRIKGHRPFQEWLKTRPRNEALDCLVYAMAAFRLYTGKPVTLAAKPENIAVDPKKPQKTTSKIAKSDWSSRL